MIILRCITTKWHGPTNSRGSRVKATAHKGQGGSLVHHWDYGIANDRPGVNDIEGNHIAAAQKLAERLGWSGEWVAGALPSEDGYAFVIAAGAFSGTLVEHSAAHAFTVAGREG